MYALFEKLIRPFPPGEPEQPPKSLYAFCRHYTRGIELHLLLMAVLSGLTAMLEVSLFSFLGQLVDWLGASSPETFLQDEGSRLLFWALLVLIGLPLLVYLHSLVLYQALMGNYPMRIRWLAHRYLLGQSLSFYQDEFAGRIATKVMQSSLAVREVVLKLFHIMIYIVVYFGGVLVIVAQSDFRLTAPFLAWLAIYACIMFYFIPRLGEISAKQANARSSMVGRIVDTYTNISTVKLFSHTGRESDYARDGMDPFLQTVYRQMRLVSGFMVAVWTLNGILVFSVAALSIHYWMQAAVTAGAIATAIGLVLRLHGMSQWMMWEMANLFENVGTVLDGINTLSRPRTVLDASNAGKLTVQRGDIRFEHVTFHYGKGSGVFDDFSLHIKEGEKVGLVGRSGAGKSTLVSLLLRFYDVEGGRILIDDQDIAGVSQESLREHIAMVTQDTSLLHRSVRDNIIYGKPDAGEEAMLGAARQAKAHDFILDLKDVRGRTGYEAHVGERGVKLSGGQRQRIAIARVLLKDAPILILDEATSALDSEVEAAIRENLNRLMRGKTVIAIAHRLSTIASMDRLVVLDQGRIVEEGTHAALIARDGLYAHLWAHQSGGFLGEDVA
ncbi:MAG TPA: ABC transporter ATP-binding protein [Gammaproteobacteria bacterium]|nr:ABC transporter ATP-binding protein [Gammaproteobacteria bacterium]